jgi:serine phosphatase RsbU (regulator of sigma subunit)
MDKQRIVIIDDNGNDAAVTRRFLERRGYDVTTALSGEEGLRVIGQVTPDAVVVDYRMPLMNGFEVARRIKSDPQLRAIPVLMLTGSDSAQNIVEGLGAGADDYVTKGSDTEVLLARVRALLRVKAYQDELLRVNQQMSRNLEIARRVQEALMPRGALTSPRLEIRSAYIPTEALSGDFYDYFEQGDLTYLFVADVSGHGLPAAILVSLLKSYLHTEADARTSLADFMFSLNNFLFSVSLPAQFATAQIFRLEGNGQLVYANAAHPPFLLHRRGGEKAVLFDQPSHLLGAMPNLPFEQQALSIEPGDTLFVYTDGLTDRRNETGEFYSIERIAAVLEQSGHDELSTTYARIHDDVTAFSATDELKDDIAFVVTRFR